MPSKYAGWRSPAYLAAYDTTTQTLTSDEQAFIWKFNSVDYSKAINIVDDSKITVSKKGLYNVQFSAQVVCTRSTNTDIYVWLTKNGSNVANTATQYTLQGNSKAEVIILNYLVNLEKNDYVQVAWSDSENSNTVSLAASLSSANPDKPAVPSIILTVWQIN